MILIFLLQAFVANDFSLRSGDFVHIFTEAERPRFEQPPELEKLPGVFKSEAPPRQALPEEPEAVAKSESEASVAAKKKEPRVKKSARPSTELPKKRKDQLSVKERNQQEREKSAKRLKTTAAAAEAAAASTGKGTRKKGGAVKVIAEDTLTPKAKSGPSRTRRSTNKVSCCTD